MGVLGGNIISPPRHTTWLKKSSNTVSSADGTSADVWELDYDVTSPILNEWAAHFRNHYCLDSEIDLLRGQLSRKDYLNQLKFPTETGGLGPSIRAGDFGEILVADLLQWLLGYWVPRVRWSSKVIKNESPKGSDVIGFRFATDNEHSPNDVLAVFEAKTKFSASGNNKLQDAINDSTKDHLRIAESLNFIKQKLIDKSQMTDALKVERFQSPADYPYSRIIGATALFDTNYETEQNLLMASANQTPCLSNKQKLVPHPNLNELSIVLIRGVDMMQLVHNLYKVAADGA